MIFGISDKTEKWFRNSVAVLLFVFGAVFLTILKINEVKINRVVIKSDDLQVKETTALIINKEAEGGDIMVRPKTTLVNILPKLVGSLETSQEFSANSILVKDLDSGLVLFRKNEYQKRPIASITKLMSALVILENSPDWESKIQATTSTMEDPYIVSGLNYKIKDLWNLALIASSNKSIKSLALNIFDEEKFVKRMNQKAAELGMTNSEFVEPTGLDEGNVSTASDLAILLNEAMKYKEIREVVRKKEYFYSSGLSEKLQKAWNTDWLLLGWIPNKLKSVEGGKTGYIKAAGYNFAVQIKNNEDKIVTVIILGSSSHEARFTEARDVAELVFENYLW